MILITPLFLLAYRKMPRFLSMASGHDLALFFYFCLSLPLVTFSWATCHCPDAPCFFPSLCPWLKLLPVHHMPLSACLVNTSLSRVYSSISSSECLPTFTSFLSKGTKHIEFSVLTIYSSIEHFNILDYWFCLLLPNSEFLKSKCYVSIKVYNFCLLFV